MTHWHERDDYYGIITFIMLLLLVVYSGWLMSWLDGILSDVKPNDNDFLDKHHISREDAQTLKMISMTILIITLIFSTTFIWEIVSEKYKLHEIIANSKTAILTSGILLGVILWANSSLDKVPKDAGGAGPALKQFTVSLIIILGIAMAVFAIPMLLKTKDVAEQMVDDTEDWMFGGDTPKKSRRRRRRRQSGRVEGIKTAPW